MSEPHPRNRGTAHRLASFGRPHGRRFAVGAVLLLATNGLALSIPWILKSAVDALESGTDLRSLTLHAASIAGIALVQAVTRTGSRLAILGASRRIAADIRRVLFAHLQRLGPSFYDRSRTGDVMSRSINDIQILRGFYGPGIMNLFNTAVVYVATVTLMSRLDPGLTLAALAPFPVLLVLVNRISRKVYARSKEVQEQLSHLSNRAQENISGAAAVRTFVQEEREIAGFREQCAVYRDRNLSLAKLRGWMMASIGVFSGVGTLIVLWVGGRAVVAGDLTLGDFVAFTAYLAILTWPTVALGWIINTFQRGIGAMERLAELLDETPDVEPAEPAAADEVPVRGDISIRGLTFAYPSRGGDSRTVLSGVDLEIPWGQRTVLVGPVGSGKSTLLALLARLYPVPRGTITIGGVDVCDLPVGRLRRSVTMVPQEAFLFSRPLGENIRFGDPDAADAAVERAVRIARLDRDVDELPRGLETAVGERGFTLSGGQRQRATVARAVLSDPQFLLLDDALAAVDADTERAIQRRLETFAAGRTVVMATHRLSSLDADDRVVVFDDGRVVEQGTHRELVEKGGPYAALVERYMLRSRLDAAGAGAGRARGGAV